MTPPAPRPTTLYGAARPKITLPDQLALVPEGAVVMLASLQKFSVRRVGSNGAVEGDDVAIAEVFEARAFTQNSETRWLRDPEDDEGHGRGVLLSEDRGLLSDAPGAEPIAPVNALDTIDAASLLWGAATTVDSFGPGWTVLSDPRIGSLAVPLDADQGQRVHLLSREYIASDEQGNCYVAEERYLELAVAPLPDQEGER